MGGVAIRRGRRARQRARHRKPYSRTRGLDGQTWPESMSSSEIHGDYFGDEEEEGWGAGSSSPLAPSPSETVGRMIQRHKRELRALRFELDGLRKKNMKKKATKKDPDEKRARREVARLARQKEADLIRAQQEELEGLQALERTNRETKFEFCTLVQRCVSSAMTSPSALNSNLNSRAQKRERASKRKSSSNDRASSRFDEEGLGLDLDDLLAALPKPSFRMNVLSSRGIEA